MKTKVSDLKGEKLAESSATKELMDALLYCKETGKFTWVKPRSNMLKPGDSAGNVDSQGYRTIAYKSKRYKAHRLAWLFTYGEWPNGQIDHINHERDDNRISNLRVVTNQGNCKNRSITSRNSSGIVGVRFRSDINKWVSEICVSGKSITGGYFETKKDAAENRKCLENKYGFHVNHGRRAVVASVYGEYVEEAV